MKINVLQMLSCGIDFDQKNAPDKVSSYRRILPQVNFQNKIFTSIRWKIYKILKIQFLSAFAQNLMSWNLGLVLALPSIVVPSVIGISSSLNPDEILHMTPDEASWIGMFYCFYDWNELKVKIFFKCILFQQVFYSSFNRLEIYCLDS